MHPEAVAPTCLRLIDNLTPHSFLNEFYLVGGTALALYLGHRLSIDLDFFTDQEFQPMIWLNKLPKGEDTICRENHFRTIVDNTKLEMIYFAYRPTQELNHWQGINILSPIDIGLYKLLAIIGRNRKKDIIDLYFIDKKIIPIPDLIKLFTEKYDSGDINLLKQVETLFDDEAINQSDMPIMREELNWDKAYAEVKEKVVRGIQELIQV